MNEQKIIDIWHSGNIELAIQLMKGQGIKKLDVLVLNSHALNQWVEVGINIVTTSKRIVIDVHQCTTSEKYHVDIIFTEYGNKLFTKDALEGFLIDYKLEKYMSNILQFGNPGQCIYDIANLTRDQVLDFIFLNE